MNTFNEVEKNDKLISGIEKTINKSKNIQAYSALVALDSINEAQKYYVMSINEEYSIGENSLRLYGLLQGLFVAIDSLYALAYGLTNSKLYININQNEKLRELKYIRNDVVGHPSNRVYSDNSIGYCVLNKEDISNTSFSYTIYVDDKIDRRHISIDTLLDNYYMESNAFLLNILKISESNKKDAKYDEYIQNLFNAFYSNGNLLEKLEELRKAYYVQIEGEVSSHTNRFSWRYDLITKLIKEKNDNDDYKELNHYAIGYELEKLVVHIAPASKLDYQHLPKYLKAFYKFLNCHSDLVSQITYIYDSTHPLFIKTLECLMTACLKDKHINAYNYLKKIYDYGVNGNSDMVYAYGILAKQYAKKK